MERPELDATGLRCPLPVLKARAFLKTQPSRTIVLIRVDDPMARVDLPHMCQSDGHRLVAEYQEGTCLIFEIETGVECAPSDPTET